MPNDSGLPEPTASIWTDPVTGAGIAALSKSGVFTAAGLQIAGTPVENLEMFRAPAGATAQTIPRWAVTNTPGAPGSGSLWMFSLCLRGGVPVNAITFMTGSTAEASGSHGAYILCDANRVVQAVSADQTGAAVWAASSAVPLPVAGAGGSVYTTPAAGLYYVGVYVVATTVPTFVGGVGVIQAEDLAGPTLGGSSNTGLTTPPAVGTQMNALAAASPVSQYYAFTS